MSSCVPAEQAVHDSTTKAHLRTWLRRRMQWVVITVQSIQVCRFLYSLQLKSRIRLFSLWRVVVDRLVTLRSSPSSLSSEEGASHHFGVDLTILCIYDCLLCLDDRTRLTLVVDTEHLTAQLELSAFGAGGKRFVKLDGALAVDYASRVELRDAWDGDGVGASVKVDNVLVGTLEGEDDAVGREDLKVWVKFL